MKHRLISTSAIVLLALGVAPALADSTTSEAAPTTDVAAPPAPVANATRASKAPTIDGALTDDVWATAAKHGGFVRRFPNPNLPAKRVTEFAVMYDNNAVYVGIWCHDDSPSEIQSDEVSVTFDSYHDRRTGFAFLLNPASVQRDMLIYDDSSIDTSWDAVWTGASAITATGWTAEYRIPLSQLRFSAKPEQTWGIQVVRAIARTGEEDVWSPWQRSDSQIVGKFGTLHGIRDVKPGRRLELLPYISGGLLKAPVDSADPLNDKLQPRYALGLDAKYGLSSAFTLSATINPDFGQVEADPSQVNLTANELYFAERRPFFLEGSELFQMGLGVGDENSETLFYSRRIGGAPHGSVDGVFTNVPTATPIYGAAKISGKTEGGWSVGVLDVVTAEETGTAIDENSNRTSDVVEPLTNFVVARVKRDFRQGKSTLGAVATGVQRALGDNSIGDILVQQAYTGGVDGMHRWGKGGAYQLNTNLYGSFVRGSAASIDRLQQLTRHNFQRPDAPHLDYDPTRTSMAGAALSWNLSNVEGDPHWRYGIGGDIRTPDFEANDLGYQTSADQAITFGFASYRDENPGGGLLSYRANANFWFYSDFEPRVAGWGGNFNGHLTTSDMWNLGGGVNYDIVRWDIPALRGGSALRGDPGLSTWAYFNSDSRHKLQISGSFNAGLVPASATWSTGGEVGAQIQARPNLELFLGPSLSVNEDDRQYVEEVADNAGDTHYIFGRIRQVTAAMTLRMSWTLTPNLGFQLYAQPFMSTGAYSDYKDADQTARSNYNDRFYHYSDSDLTRSDDAIAVSRDRSGRNAYTFSRPDFGFQEMRSTLVVRWQYRPGSTIFAIWSHGQSTSDSDGRFNLGSEISALAKSDSEDVVMLKANYWFGL